MEFCYRIYLAIHRAGIKTQFLTYLEEGAKIISDDETNHDPVAVHVQNKNQKYKFQVIFQRLQKKGNVITLDYEI